MHVISSGGIPLALFLLVRGYRRGSPGDDPRRAGSSRPGSSRSASRSGLMLFYLLAAGSARGRRSSGGGAGARARRAASSSPARPGCSASRSSPGMLARPYMRVLDAHPEARRTIENVAGFSGPPYEFLAAARSSRVWGAATEPLRDGLGAIAEMTLFPGLAILALALAGWRLGTLPARLRRGLAIGVLAFAILSLGFQLNGLSWLYPYRWLYEFLPGWQGIRVPGRLHTLTTLCLALLAGAGAAALAARAARALGRARRRRRGRRVACLAILAEGWGFADHPTVPLAPPGQRAAPQPALHLPARRVRQPPLRAVVDRRLPDDRQRPRQLHPAPVRGAAARRPRASPTRARSPTCGGCGVRSVTVHVDAHAARQPAARGVNPIAARTGPRAHAARRRGALRPALSARRSGAAAARRARRRAARSARRR